MQQQSRVEGFFANGLLLVVALLLLPSLSIAASFEGLGHDGVPVALTDDGVQIWGECDGSAACSDGWRWSPAQGLVAVPFIPKAVTGDGAYATGQQGDSVIRWTTATGAVDVLASPGEFAAGCGSPWQSTGGPYALAISDDGETVMFRVDRAILNFFLDYPWPQPPPWCAVDSSVWLKTVGQERENLYLFTSHPLWNKTLVAASVEQESVAVTAVVGFDQGTAEVWPWGLDWEIGSGDSFGGGQGSETGIYAMSGSGVSVAGSTEGRAAIWPSPEAHGVQLLADSPLLTYSRATGLSDAADRAVGVFTADGGVEGTFFWSRVTGFLPLSDLLAAVGVDVTGWNLVGETVWYFLPTGDPLKISGDGTTIVGLGTNPDGDPEVWRVVLPDLASIPLPAQAPIVFSPYPIYVDETGVVNYPVDASDPNGDTLSFAMQDPSWVDGVSTWNAPLPPGFSIDPTTGMISGALSVQPTHDNATSYYAEVTVSDGTLETVFEIVFVVVRPNFYAPGTYFSEEGTSVSFTPRVEYPAPGMSWSATGLPPGLSIDPVTGVISGALAEDAAQSSPYSVSVSMNDGEQTTTHTFEWEVLESVSVPALAPGSYLFLAALLIAGSVRRLSRRGRLVPKAS